MDRMRQGTVRRIPLATAAVVDQEAVVAELVAEAAQVVLQVAAALVQVEEAAAAHQLPVLQQACSMRSVVLQVRQHRTVARRTGFALHGRTAP
jgi:hypothetical protein